jgi:TDG/mug DNA glycosylase family protein
MSPVAGRRSPVASRQSPVAGSRGGEDCPVGASQERQFHPRRTEVVHRSHPAGPDRRRRSAAVRRHQSRPAQRRRAGITDHLIDASAGLAPADRDYLLRRGVGITSLVKRATASADEITPAELAEGAKTLDAKIVRFRPRAVAILGVTAYRTAFAKPGAVLGRQPEDLHGSQLWVVPNPSGRNAHAPLDTLAAAYREVAQAAGLSL